MTTQRTDDDKLMKVTIQVVLGGKEYEITPLPIKYSLPWCKKVVAMLGDVLPLMNIDSDNAKEFEAALNLVMVDKPEQIVNLFFEYAKNLPKKAIEESASSAEVIQAFEEVLGLERPLLGSTLRLVQRLVPAGALPNSSSSPSPSGTSHPNT